MTTFVLILMLNTWSGDGKGALEKVTASHPKLPAKKQDGSSRTRHGRSITTAWR